MCLRNVETQRAEILRDDFPWDEKGFRLQNIQIRRTISWKKNMYTGATLDFSGQFYSPQYESSRYLGGW